ncbi:SGNH/GDSL hydrolase family protein [Microvirga makkahensis]|uniref:D-alanyl-lipoteichoic acid acyltransferase DltB, MBOAT superfamily n=1 Tax=Microvirga makkahensis TaxID=1128670 RepID=A0A7X3SQX4_9HYPH|nr:hypothetical protein [Microvirga makkahensis]MXQ13579.1 hypothetical protein [Microvirga makkahensis]
METPFTSVRSAQSPEVDNVLAGSSPSKEASAFEAYWEQVRQDLTFRRLLRLGVIVVELALVAVAVRLLNVESPAFEAVLTLALGGFLIHHFLPASYRIFFFAALSVATVPLVFGWQAGTWLLAFGGMLIALCHVPVAFHVRIVLIAALALALALARKQVFPVFDEIPPTIWPILGSMFMFRLIVYLYDLKHEAAPFSASRAVAYFFMLPSVCMPLFPVVDYKTFQRSFYNTDPLRLYQTGVKWILRGLIHLTLYKAVYFLAVVEPGSVVNGAGAARYMASTFLLYLKISGLFHIVVGLLHLYGFGLAETHHFYLFSSSFTDFWRRINIYWKEFIQKIVFNPAYFRLRKRGETFAVATATLIAFGATWLLHSYQWFWIRGDFPIVWADIVFWFGLGLVVLANVLLESRKGRQRTLAKPVRTFRDDAVLAAKTAGTFAAICVLWTIWSTPNVAELTALWRGVLNSGPFDVLILLGIPAAIGVLGAVFRNRKRETAGSDASDDDRRFMVQAGAVTLTAGLLIVIALHPSLLQPASPTLAKLITDLRDRNQLNASDEMKMVRGYYEDLGDAGRFNHELGMMFGVAPADWKGSVPVLETHDAIEAQFVPSTATVATGTIRTINSIGLRDREYPRNHDSGTFRIGLVGSSHDMGWGVRDDETYENVVEDRLNRELGPVTGKKFEIMNFSFRGYGPTQKLAVIEQRMFPYRPDLVLYVANTTEFLWMFKSASKLAQYALLDQFPYVEEAIIRAGLNPAMLPTNDILTHKLAPFAEDALLALLRRFGEGTLARGAQPALVLLEIPKDGRTRKPEFDRLVSIGRAAGLPILDLQGSFAKVRDRQSLWVAPWDNHSNADGHRLLADRLYALLIQQQLVPTKPSGNRPRIQSAR